MNLLKLGLDAELPLIALYTDDLVNAVDVINHITKYKVAPLPGHAKASFSKTTRHVYYTVAPEDKEPVFANLYGLMLQHSSTLIVINPPRPFPIMYNAGVLPVPKEMLLEYVSELEDDPVKQNALVQRLGAISLKDASELLRLTMAHTKGLTPQGIAHTRRMLFKRATGLLPVATEQEGYVPHPKLEKWAASEKDYFLSSTIDKLRPRGLLLDGPSGTGKSSGAKYIAETWGVSCYMLSMGTLKSKWIGESQGNLASALAVLEREEPCVLLLDEMEKFYGGGHDEGTSTEMLGQLLWWLAEHRSRVLTVMTTNDKNKLPPELYRPGRIDAVMLIDKLTLGEAKSLAMTTLRTFMKKAEAEKHLAPVMALVGAANTEQMTFKASPAAVVHTVYAYLKSIKFGL